MTFSIWQKELSCGSWCTGRGTECEHSGSFTFIAAVSTGHKQYCHEMSPFPKETNKGSLQGLTPNIWSHSSITLKFPKPHSWLHTFHPLSLREHVLIVFILSALGWQEREIQCSEVLWTPITILAEKISSYNPQPTAEVLATSSSFFTKLEWLYLLLEK